MKRVGVLCCLFLAPWVFGQNTHPTNDSEVAKLIALERMWNQAQLLRDAQALEGLVGDRFVNTEWDGELSRKAKFLADIRDPQFQPTAMSIQDVNVELYGDTAIVVGVYHTKGTYKGKPYDHLGRFTDTWIHQGNKWQCVASHTSLLPKRN